MERSSEQEESRSAAASERRMARVMAWRAKVVKKGAAQVDSSRSAGPVRLCGRHPAAPARPVRVPRRDMKDGLGLGAEGAEGAEGKGDEAHPEVVGWGANGAEVGAGCGALHV